MLSCTAVITNYRFYADQHYIFSLNSSGYIQTNDKINQFVYYSLLNVSIKYYILTSLSNVYCYPCLRHYFMAISKSTPTVLICTAENLYH
ncbi:hypothetical protein C3B55_00996 [Candidatus Pseudomonas adelgestsugas]|uniref:Uncharacterized protein n=1 Tax=Candidatus Pseudomonas adelgestsugas TaxID=1302376 RepID=A0ABX5R9T2_9PSED|nr:hypothetical protein C3B55_00996 [Candidatus Pseudomonas adelgestsugas]